MDDNVFEEIHEIPIRRGEAPPLPNEPEKPLSKRVKKQLRDTKDALIKVKKINIVTQDYDAIIDNLRPLFKEYATLRVNPNFDLPVIHFDSRRQVFRGYCPTLQRLPFSDRVQWGLVGIRGTR